MRECEVWIKMNDAGDYAVGVGEDDVNDEFDSQIGGNGPTRYVKLLVKVSTPKPLDVTVNIGEESVKVLVQTLPFAEEVSCG